jgi:hypothetical protein
MGSGPRSAPRLDRSRRPARANPAVQVTPGWQARAASARPGPTSARLRRVSDGGTDWIPWWIRPVGPALRQRLGRAPGQSAFRNPDSPTLLDVPEPYRPASPADKHHRSVRHPRGGRHIGAPLNLRRPGLDGQWRHQRVVQVDRPRAGARLEPSWPARKRPPNRRPAARSAHRATAAQLAAAPPPPKHHPRRQRRADQQHHNRVPK